ncbi:hypothetical protein [Halobacterium salinarum]|uniref:hypothetical protein n=1 Tax=Halobacterium salinarum TaxID=2242 RepID=UPI002553F758|nr:hypothetical protein [Halobacterium salinarum]MDL0144527.1 hypothetical protein [Halobacterium salinarum]
MEDNYWSISVEDEYVQITEQGNKTVAEDTRHELSVWGHSEEEALEVLEEANRERIVLKYIKKNERVSLSELVDDVDISARYLTSVLDTLFIKGEIYEPQRNQIKVVPEE